MKSMKKEVSISVLWLGCSGLSIVELRIYGETGRDTPGERSSGESLIPAKPPRQLQHKLWGNFGGCLTRKSCGQT